MKVSRRSSAQEAPARIGWEHHLETLRGSLEARKPDVLQQIRGEIMRLDGQISALKNRCSLAAGSAENQQRGFESGEKARHQRALEMLAKRRGRIPETVVARVARMEAEITALEGNVGDLAGLIQHLRAEPLATDEGGTPETLGKRKDWLAVYAARRRITVDQWHAGLTFADTAQKTEAGSRSCLDRDQGEGTIDSAAFFGGEALRLAKESHLAAVRAMGPVNSSTVSAVTLNGMSANALAKHLGCKEDDTFRSLDGGLKALVEHYRVDTLGFFR